MCTAGLGGIAGLVLGIAALKKIRRSGRALRGRALASAGAIGQKKPKARLREHLLVDSPDLMQKRADP